MLIRDFMRHPVWAAADEPAGAGADPEPTADPAPTGNPAPKDPPADPAPTDDPAPAKAEDWREQITDPELQDELRDHAGRFLSITDLVKGNKQLRSERDKIKQNAIVPPGEDASEEEVAEFRKKLGVPESPDGYDVLKPAEDEEISDFEKQSREAWMQTFHEAALTKDQAQKVVEAWREHMAESEKAVEQEDKRRAEENKKIMQREWGDDYDQNESFAYAVLEKSPEAAEKWKRATVDNQLLMDDPDTLRLFAQIGREMQEGSMGAMTDDQRETLEGQADEARQKRNEAMAKGDRESAAKWDEKERELLAKIGGSGPIVGAQGRAA